jgi:hypothetical protein
VKPYDSYALNKSPLALPLPELPLMASYHGRHGSPARQPHSSTGSRPAAAAGQDDAHTAQGGGACSVGEEPTIRKEFPCAAQEPCVSNPTALPPCTACHLQLPFGGQLAARVCCLPRPPHPRVGAARWMRHATACTDHIYPILPSSPVQARVGGAACWIRGKRSGPAAHYHRPAPTVGDRHRTLTLTPTLTQRLAVAGRN